MKIKEYLMQAYRIDQRINSKLEQIGALHDLEDEINHDIDELVDLKTDITHLIKSLDSHEYQIILEQRYLCFKSWEKISVDLGYSIQHTFRLHDAALTDLERFYKDES